MILVWMLVITMGAGLAAWLAARVSPSLARWICLAALVVDLALAVGLWQDMPPGSVSVQPAQGWHGEASMSDEVGHAPPCLEQKDAGGTPARRAAETATPRYFTSFSVPWIPQLGISFHLAVDGLSVLMIALTAFLGIMSVACSWSEITHRVGFFHFNLMLILTGILGVFLAMDMFLFYFFWELMLVPMYFLIGIWGHERRVYASIKFFLFTQAGGLLMFLAILGLYFAHHAATETPGASGEWTFDYPRLLGTAIAPGTAMWLMLGFFAAFAVKLPAVPLHTWLPDAHTQAPTAGSVILAGLLLKTGAYGLIRFAVPLFPEASATFAPVAMTLGVVGILYGAILAFGQRDLKRLVAYTSVSHLGFVLLGVYALNHLALQGAVMQMLCHGISTGAMFMIVGLIQERIGTRDLTAMGGLWSVAPRLGGVAMVFALASLGLPGLGNFVAEFLVLLGAYQASVTLTAVATLGFIASAIYALWIVQRAFHGPRPETLRMHDIGARETVTLSLMIVAIVWLGVYPQPVFRAVDSALAGGTTNQSTGAAPSRSEAETRMGVLVRP